MNIYEIVYYDPDGYEVPCGTIIGDNSNYVYSEMNFILQEEASVDYRIKKYNNVEIYIKVFPMVERERFPHVLDGDHYACDVVLQTWSGVTTQKTTRDEFDLLGFHGGMSWATVELVKIGETKK